MIQIMNDVMYLGDYVILSSILLLILVASVIWHELGHLIYFNWFLKKKIKLFPYYNSILHFGGRIGHDSDYSKISDTQYVRLFLWGILFGMIPILVASIVNVAKFPYLMMLIPYIALSWHDIKCMNDLTQDD